MEGSEDVDQEQLLKKIEQLEKDEKSLKQNLLDTISDLKTTEKENELIFAEKQSSKNKLREETEKGTLPPDPSETRKNDFDDLPPSPSPVPAPNPPPFSQPPTSSLTNKSLIEESTSLLQQSDSLITRIAPALPRPGQSQLFPSPALALIREETHNEADEEEKDKGKIDKVIGIIEGIEKDLKRSVHKEGQGRHATGSQPVFDKRNKQGGDMEAIAGLNTSTGAVVPGKHGNKHRGKSKVNQLLPNVSFENETISTSSRVYENRDKTQIEGDKRSNTPFRVKGNKG
eukprot:CAMPEP_0168329818 /NCGR_PEP_ID=MMETSP0213-20121227/7338_1 /TAXON_ID=151035 /ORGANISM="Euplotes harpa, Strain FSP1.4" /LENGTH=285 /DNA_ID=CAMNT_0008333223 /DNA_START=155 /DNA_END=1009 /DNA_ORIENTATION=-